MESTKNRCPLCRGEKCLVLGREDRYPMYNRYFCMTYDRVFSVGDTTIRSDDGALAKKISDAFLEQRSDNAETGNEHLKFFFEPSYKVTEEEKRLGFVNLAEL